MNDEDLEDTDLKQATDKPTIVGHTPGPWKACNGSHENSCICGLVWSKCSDKLVAIVATQRCKVDEHDWASPPDAESQANARLIAAAPDLLDALTKLMLVVESQQWGQPWSGRPHVEADAASAAIAKATKVTV